MANGFQTQSLGLLIALKKLYPLFILAGTFLLSSCNDRPEVKTICQQDPHLCRGLNEDGWCQNERAEVVYSEYALKSERNEFGIYKALVAWEGYRDCIELAAHVEMRRLKIRQSQRVEGYIRAEQAITDYLAETQNAQHPSLLWYHWSREGNKEAYEKFVALEKSGQLDTPELILNIAAHYAAEDQEKAIGYLLQALTMYPDEDDIDPKIFAQLTTLTYQLKDYKHSYIWALVTKKKEAGVVDMARLQEDGHLTVYEQHRAEEIAEQILTQLGTPEFKPLRSYPFK